MTVYVDNMFESPMGRFGRMKMSHMIADTDDELHAMAKTIGVARRWYQGDHYDICKSKRELAIAAGAQAIEWRETSAMVMRRRNTGILGLPSEAAAWFKAELARRQLEREKEKTT